MKIQYFGLAFSTLFFMACGAGTIEPEQSSPQEEEETVETAQALRSCTSDLNCAGGCQCTMGSCGPDGFGPPTPQSICDAPPKLHCSAQADCPYLCSCVSGSCENNPFSPQTDCLHPRPDGFESDDTHLTASSYPGLGTPQLNHRFDRVGDVDWIVGTAPVNQVLTVDAYNLRSSTLGNFPQIRIEIYKYDRTNRILGTLIGSTQSLICNYLSASCNVFRATASVTAGSGYAVKVIDRRTGPLNNYDLTGPSYDIKMY